MNPKPYVLKGNIWALDATFQEFGVSANVPGLRWNESIGWTGSIDAIAVACKRLGRELPSQFLKRVNGISQLPMYEYQHAGVAACLTHIRNYGGALLGDDLGIGKTRQGAAIALHMGGRCFVVCPAAVRETWRNELTKLGVNKDNILIAAPGASKVKSIEARILTSQFVVTSYELAADVYSRCFKRETPRLLIMDEIHMLAGWKTARRKVLDQLAAMIPYKLGLTATPMFDRPRDLWGVLHALFGGTFGSKWDFDHAYCAAQEVAYGGIDNKGVSNTEELRLRLSYYMVRRLKSEVASQLPKLTRQIIWIDAEDAATRAFHSAIITRAPGSTQAALAQCLRGKMPEAMRIASNAKRFLLATWTKEHAKEMWQLLNNSGTPCNLITGEKSHKQRQLQISDAAQKRIGVVATIDSCFQGVDGFQHVSGTLIVHALDWRPEKLAQLEGRKDRTGQTEPVNVYYLAMRASMDQRVMEVALPKIDAKRALMSSADEGISETLSSQGVDGFDANDAYMQDLYAQLPNESEEE